MATRADWGTASRRDGTRFLALALRTRTDHLSRFNPGKRSWLARLTAASPQPKWKMPILPKLEINKLKLKFER